MKEDNITMNVLETLDLLFKEILAYRDWTGLQMRPIRAIFPRKNRHSPHTVSIAYICCFKLSEFPSLVYLGRAMVDFETYSGIHDTTSCVFRLSP